MEINKLMAAALVAGITFFLCGLIGQNLVHPEHLRISAIKIDVAEPVVAGAPEVALAPIGPLLASADAAAGEAKAKTLCGTCHTFTEGGKAGQGPNIYGVVGRERAAGAFSYSNGFKAKTGTWSFEDLNAWLRKPAGFAPGTKMAFAGISNDKQRADVIAYLRGLSKSPVPLP